MSLQCDNLSGELQDQWSSSMVYEMLIAAKVNIAVSRVRKINDSMVAFILRTFLDLRFISLTDRIHSVLKRVR